MKKRRKNESFILEDSSSESESYLFSPETLNFEHVKLAGSAVGRMSKRKRDTRALLFILLCLTIFCIFYYTNYLTSGKFSLIGQHESGTTTTTGDETEAKAEETVNAGEGESECRFPRLHPLHPSVREFVKSPASLDCSQQFSSVFRTNFGNNLIRTTYLQNATCCYRVFLPYKADESIEVSKNCFPITKDVTQIPNSHEFISITCRRKIVVNDKKTNHLKNTTRSNIVHRDMFAFVPLKSSVEARLEKFHKLSRYNQNNTEHQIDRLNVLVLGLDAQSHMNFIRQMPLTYEFLTSNLSAVGLHGYTKVGDNTFPNVIPLLTGQSVARLKKLCWPKKSSYFDSCPFIWKDFAASGYRTLYAEDAVWMGTFSYEKKGFLQSPTDYYLYPLAYMMASKIGHENWGNAKLCYGPRLAFEVLLDYIIKAAVRFHLEKRRLYFQHVWANSLFHDYLNNPKLGDQALYMTLQFLSVNGFLDDTVLIITSDHGIRWGPIRTTFQGKIEERMPLAYIAFPQWFRKKYYTAMTNLRKNAWRLTTPYDLHATMEDLLQLDRLLKLGPKYYKQQIKSIKHGKHDIKFGQSLFEDIPTSRTCAQAGIEEHWCVCHSLVKVSTSSEFVKDAAQFIVESLNNALIKYPQCAKLRLYKIEDAFKRDDSIDDENNSTQGKDVEHKNATNDKTEILTSAQLQLTVITHPGGGMFEATLFQQDTSWSLSGDISRINAYGAKSLCVSEPTLQRYCFCTQVQDSQILE